MLQDMTDAPIAAPDENVLADMLSAFQTSPSGLQPDKPLNVSEMFDSFAYTGDAPVDVEVLKVVLETTPLIRAKGHTGTHRLQAVGNRFTLLEAEIRRPALVFIAEKDKVDWNKLAGRLNA